MRDRPPRHPLAALRAQLGLSATEYLQRVDARHRALGFGHTSIRREKVSRWEAGLQSPEMTAQLAMANLHGVPDASVRKLGWPDWLLLACPEDGRVIAAPWTPAGTVESLTASAQEGIVDRRDFLLYTGVTLGAITADWAATLGRPAIASTGRRQLTPTMVSHLERRLDDLRRLDDVLGGGELRRASISELRLLTSLAKDAAYTAQTGQRLFSAISEAARICGWLHFDAGSHAAAQKLFVTALRASADANDAEVGANVLAFMAIQTYSTGNPQDAVSLARTAQEQAAHRTTPRVRSMLHARTARALSKTPHSAQACARELDAARDAFAQGPHDNDPSFIYWMTEGEIEMLAGSCALDLQDPRRALSFFDAAHAADYSAGGYVRDQALFLTRRAEALLALGQVEEACATAREAFEQSGDVDSTRPVGAITDFRKRLIERGWSTAAVSEFLELTA